MHDRCRSCVARQLLAKCEEIAAAVVEAAPIAVRTIKRLVQDGLDAPSLEAGLALEAQGFDELMATEDAQEGTDAFAARRPPVWKGQ